MLGRALDSKYLAWMEARRQVTESLQKLMTATRDLAGAIQAAQSDLRLPFSVWCRKHSRKFDVMVSKTVCGVAHRTRNEGDVETWQLRMLGVVRTIHHAERPQAQVRRNKPTSWLTHINRTHAELGKLFERVGGVEKMPTEERLAILRQVQSFSNLTAKLKIQ